MRGYTSVFPLPWSSYNAVSFWGWTSSKCLSQVFSNWDLVVSQLGSRWSRSRHLWIASYEGSTRSWNWVSSHQTLWSIWLVLRSLCVWSRLLNNRKSVIIHFVRVTNRRNWLTNVVELYSMASLRIKNHVTFVIQHVLLLVNKLLLFYILLLWHLPLYLRCGVSFWLRTHLSSTGPSMHGDFFVFQFLEVCSHVSNLLFILEYGFVYWSL
jgi:hypothetical protein